MQFENKFVLGSAQFGMKYGIANLTGSPNQAEVDSLIDLANLNDIKKIDTLVEQFVTDYNENMELVNATEEKTS